MPEYCDVCFKQIDAFNPCDHASKSSVWDSGEDDYSSSSSKFFGFITLTMVAISPLLGVLFDFVVPRLSGNLESVIEITLCSALVTGIWIFGMNRGTNNPLAVLRRNLHFILLPPLALKQFAGSAESKKLMSTWVATFVATWLLTGFIWTPGDAVALETGVVREVKESSGASITVDCTDFLILTLDNDMTCELGTGILGITIPVHVYINPLTNSVTYDVSLT